MVIIMKKLKSEIDNRLQEILDYFEETKTKEAMAYSLLVGGKRLRPIIMLQVIRSYDLNYLEYLDVACAIEMLHTYSLIHDDLPAMDNDDFRRGVPTCHKQYDEATAILAGDGLLNGAVEIILETQIADDLKINLLKELYRASGVNGMIKGQTLDLEFENKTANLKQLQEIHQYKTGKMIEAAFKMGALVANRDYEIWGKIGQKIGLAFQIQDDLLDIIGTTESLGKPVGSDLDNHKSTYIQLLGLEESNIIVKKLLNEACELLYSMKINHGLILQVIESIRRRES